MDDTPVELDYTPKTHTRRRWSRRIALSTSALMVAIIAVASVLLNGRNDGAKQTNVNEASPVTTEATIPLERSADSVYRSAWLTYWDDGIGLDTFRANAGRFTEFHPFWYEVQSASTIVSQGTTATRRSALQAAEAAGVKIVPTLTESLETKDFLAFMGPDTSRRQHVDTVCRLVIDNNFDGIDIDYETFALNVAGDDVLPARHAFTAFVTDLAGCLHDANKTLQVTLLPKTNDDLYASYLHSLTPGVFDYKAIGAAADIVRPMAYDNATPLTASASTDPLPWVRAVGEYTRKYVPARKVVLGVALYGYDWGSHGAKSITARQAATLARQKNANVIYNDRVRSRFFEYKATDGSTHSVWFNTSADTAERAQIAKDLGLAGVSYWSLGNEDRDFWNTVE